MRDFDETRWSPTGSRPHIVVSVPDPIAEVAAAYQAHANAWWSEQDDRPFDGVFRATAREYLHLTLTWVDRLTSSLPGGPITDIEAALRARLRRLDPLSLTVGPGLVGYYALELYVAPTPAADKLAAAARAALRDVLGPTAAPEPTPARPWCPHIAVFCGRQRTDTDGLASRILYLPPPGHTRLLLPVTMPVDHVLLVDQDTWGVDGLAWNRDTERSVALGAR